MTAVCAPYWRSSFATATVAAVDVLSKLAANLVKEKRVKGLSPQSCVLTESARRPEKIQNAMVRACEVS